MNPAEKKRYRESQDDGPAIYLTANRKIEPPSFLAECSIQHRPASQNLSDSMPVKSRHSVLYRSACLGSRVLKEYKEQIQRKMENQGASFSQIDSNKSLRNATTRAGDLSRDRTHLEIFKSLTESHENGRRDLNKVRVGPSKFESSLGKELHENTHVKFKCPDLPITKLKREFLRALEEHQVLIVCGETGSGKTTQLPKYLYSAGYAKNGIIGCTQPRRSAVKSIATRVSEEMGCEVGTLVGYSMRFEDFTSSQTKIRYMTDGVLCRECSENSSKYLAKYSSIILDEVHERSLDTDLLLGFMHEVLQLRRDFRLIITSATIQSKEYLEFFPGAHVFHIPGRSYNVEKIYSTLPVDDYVEQAVSLAIDIHKTKDISGDILIFMTGRDDVMCTIELIQTKLANFFPELGTTLLLLPVYSMLSSIEQSLIFIPAPRGKRKCIVSTNIAETSLTIDGIKYVIDTGFVKMKVFRPSFGINLLDIFPISQAQAVQRAGRAGRTSEGVCFRLYTREQYEDEMLKASVPEIQRTSLSRVVLHIRSLGIQETSFKFLTPPSQIALLQACKALWMIGAVDDNNLLTKSGKLMLAFPTDLLLSSFLIESAELGCSEEAASIVALLCIEYRKILDFSKKQAHRNFDLEKYYICGSDHLTLLNIYEHYQRNPLSEEWTITNKVSQKIFREAEKIRIQLREILIKLKFPLRSCGSNYDIVKKALAYSHFVNGARINGISEYIPILEGGYPVKLQSASSVLMSHAADYVVYHEIVGIGSDREYLSIVTEVDPRWVIEKKAELFQVFDAAHEEVKLNSKSLIDDGGASNAALQTNDVFFSGEVFENPSNTPKGRLRNFPTVKFKQGKSKIYYSGNK